MEKLQALVLIPDLSCIRCSMLDLLAITRLSRFWLSCQMTILLLPGPEGGQMRVRAGKVAGTWLLQWLLTVTGLGQADLRSVPGFVLYLLHS